MQGERRPWRSFSTGWQKIAESSSASVGSCRRRSRRRGGSITLNYSWAPLWQQFKQGKLTYCVIRTEKSDGIPLVAQQWRFNMSVQHIVTQRVIDSLTPSASDWDKDTVRLQAEMNIAGLIK